MTDFTDPVDEAEAEDLDNPPLEEWEYDPDDVDVDYVRKAVSAKAAGITLVIEALQALDFANHVLNRAQYWGRSDGEQKEQRDALNVLRHALYRKQVSEQRDLLLLSGLHEDPEVNRLALEQCLDFVRRPDAAIMGYLEPLGESSGGYYSHVEDRFREQLNRGINAVTGAAPPSVGDED